MGGARVAGILLTGAALASLGAPGCGDQVNGATFATGKKKEPGAGGGFGDFGDPASGGLRAQQQSCATGETTVTGKVYAPNGTLALYNAIVYVPNAAPNELQKGATCDKCGAVTGDPIVTALSGSDGSFVLHNVPVGDDIPLVIQIGKWRREVAIPTVTACQENALTDPELTRLPRNQSEGDMPRIALTSGGCDQLGCMLPKIGIDASEIGVASDGPSKSVHVYNGDGGSGPAGSDSATSLWGSADTLKNYDMVILSCECDEMLDNKGGANGPPFAAMNDYLSSGGRIFTTDFMYSWYRYSPDPAVRAAASISGGAPQADSPLGLDSSFPKGKALVDWLSSVANIPNGQVPADSVFGNVTSLDSSKAQQWATSTMGGTSAPRVFTMNMPVSASPDQQCGKGVHIDAHVNLSEDDDGNPTGDVVDATYPAGCNSPLKPAEHLLAFFFFDLASCIQKDTAPPEPPTVVK